jgi:hypothetical protein
MTHTLAWDHSVNRRNAVTPDKPKPGGSWFHVHPELEWDDYLRRFSQRFA